MTQQAEAEFGAGSKIFSDLKSTFEPIFGAGPSQEGYSAGEKNVLNSQAATGQGQAYSTAEQAINKQLAATGAGLPSGVATRIKTGLAGSAAQNLSAEQLAIQQADYERGYQNWQIAGQALAGAPSVFNASTGAAGAANQGGSAAAQTAEDISAQNNSWLSAVGGALGGVSSAVGGYFGAKCWVASAYFGGWFEPRTILVRSYLNGPFSETWYGKPIMYLYGKFGQRIARHPRIVKMLGPLFELALRKASL